MAEPLFEPAAADAYDRLPQILPSIIPAVDGVLDHLSSDSGSVALHKIALSMEVAGGTQRLWRVPIRHRGQDWSLIWCQPLSAPETVLVVYLGPADYSG